MLLKLMNQVQNVTFWSALGHRLRATYCECYINAEKMGATVCMGSSSI